MRQPDFGPDSAEGKVPGIQPPARRPLKIFAFDPTYRRSAGNLVVVDVVNETLLAGPEGRLVKVVDYDASNDVYYAAVNLDAPEVLMQRGIDPSDSDPRFHQQMVYAVVMKVIENFERALGYSFRWRGSSKLTVLPHAFEGENAFYDPSTNSLHFGYFAADTENPGPNLPGQTVFTCLSHDIIAHETTHAVVDRIRDHFNAPTNRDVLAFHEAIADIVAIFQHFSFPEVLRHEIRATRADLTLPGRLLELAAQFGYSTGSGRALRSALDNQGAQPDPSLYATLLEPHDRGSILVSAVFDAFFRIYRRRLDRYVRIATGGTGVLPDGELQADLADTAAREAASTAQDVLTMCLRAFEYLPPVDVTFGDYLRAIVTADFELNPRDEFERRSAFIDSFRVRGIYAPNVSSLAEEALRLDRPPDLEGISLTEGVVGQALARQFDYVHEGESHRRAGVDPRLLERFARDNAEALQLDRDRKIQVVGFHPSFHVDENGQLLAELVAQWVQTPRDGESRHEIGGVVLRAGTTVVFGADGSARYVAAKPLPGPHLSTDTQREAAEARVAEFHRYGDALDEHDTALAWVDSKHVANRMSRRANLAAAHRQRRPVGSSGRG